MNTCPKCGSQARQNLDGVTRVGSQRYKCMQCGSKYTRVQKARGYDQETRKKAIQLLWMALTCGGSDVIWDCIIARFRCGCKRMPKGLTGAHPDRGRNGRVG